MQNPREPDSGGADTPPTARTFLRRRTSKRRATGPHAAAPRARKRVVIVGNGMVSHHLCAALVREGAGAVDLVVFGEEGVPAYDRVHLGEVLRGRTTDSLLLAPREWYERHGIELHLDDCVVGLDRERRVVRSARGLEVGYDALVLATGAAPVFPPIAVDPGSHVFVLRTIGDFERVRTSLPSTRRAVVVGGGLLGVETASALREADVEVTVVEHGPRLLHRLLDAEASRVLGGRLKRAGVGLRAGVEVKGVHYGADGAHVQLGTGESLPADLIIIAAGALPRDDLARAADLVTDAHGGFAVDELLRTSDPRVYAVGDCAVAGGSHCGAITPGYQMADCLARTLAGHPTPFRSESRVVRLEVAGFAVLIAGAAPSAAGRVISGNDGQSFRQVVVHEGRLVRAVAIGPWDGWPRVEDAIRTGQPLSEARVEAYARGDSLWGDTPRAGELRDGALVCACNGVSAGMIRGARAEGCTTVAAITARTGAGGSCGGCTVTVERLLTGGVTTAVSSRRPLVTGAIAALLAVALLLLARPALSLSPALIGAWDLLLRDPGEQQATGYAALAMVAAAAALPLARVVPRLRRTIGRWRIVHAVVGASAMLLLAVHSGLRLGQRLNLALTVLFVAVAVTGAAAGFAFAAGARRPTRIVRFAHLTLVWPALALLGLHIAAVYYF